MINSRSSIFLSIIASTLSLATMHTASANSYWHSTNSEAGYATYPDHFKSEKTREQVKAEAAEFQKNGGAEINRESGYPLPEKTKPSSTTRQQVIDEMLSENPEERKARLEMYKG